MTVICIPTGNLSLGICRPAAFPIKRHLSVAQIKHEVEQFYGVDIARGSADRNHARPRQVAMYLARILTRKSYPALARMFGGYDHSTIVHGVRLVQKLIETDPDFAADVETLRARIVGL